MNSPSPSQSALHNPNGPEQAPGPGKPRREPPREAPAPHLHAGFQRARGFRCGVCVPRDAPLPRDGVSPHGQLPEVDKGLPGAVRDAPGAGGVRRGGRLGELLPSSGGDQLE